MAKRRGRQSQAVQGRLAARSPHSLPTIFPFRKPLAIFGSVAMPLACALIAASLMYGNLSYGLPFYYHPDEPYKAVSAVGVTRGTVPPRFNHPQFMLLFSVPFLSGGGALGAHPLLAARAAVATLGVATVCLLYVVGRALAGPVAGVAAALLYATAPLAVVAAHDFKEDIPLAFWLTVQLFFLVRYLRGARSRDLFLAAAALGGAVGAKYTGLIAVPLLGGAVWWGPASGRRGKTLGTAALVAAVAFLLSTPSILWHPDEFLAGLSFEGQHAMFGHGITHRWGTEERFSVMSPRNPLKISPLPYLWTYHLRYSLVPGLSIAGLLLTLVGALMALTRGDRAWGLVAAGLGLFYFVLETLPLKPPPFAARYMVVVLPYAALLGGGAVAFAWKGSLPQKALIGLLLAATLGVNGFRSVQQVSGMRPDTRDAARAWIVRNVPQGARFVLPGMVWYTPFAGSFEQQDFPYEIAALQDPSYSDLLTASLAPRAYLVVSSFTYQRYLDYPDFNPDMYRFYRFLFDRYAPLATVQAPYRALGFHNPTIMIFHLVGGPSAQPAPAPAAPGDPGVQDGDPPPGS